MMIRPPLLLTLAALVAAPAFAESADPSAQASDDQLVLDATVVPEGMAALFVPSLTRADLEPPVIVYANDKRIATGPTGRRIIVAPGKYRVTLAYPDDAGHPSYEVEAAPDTTTVIRPMHGALQIDAVDGRGRLIDQMVRITASDGRTVSQSRTDRRLARESKAILLTEDRYVASLGDPTQPDVSTVMIPLRAGERARYRLVVEDGVIHRTDLADEAPIVRRTPWRLRLRLGGDFSFQSARRQLNFSGDALQVGVSGLLETTYDRGRHLVDLDLMVSQSWIGVSNEVGGGLPFQKLDDGARAELSYYYRLGRIFGPYARVQAWASFFPSSYVSARDQTVVEPDGTERSVASGDSVDLLDAMRPVVLQQGAGFGLTVLDFDAVSLIAKGGAALRQSFYAGGRYVTSSARDRVVLIALQDYEGWGFEAQAKLTVRFGEALWVDSILDGYIDRDQLLSGDRFSPVFRWSNRVAWSFNESTSLTYDFALHRDEFGLDDLQHRHLVSLRAHLSLL